MGTVTLAQVEAMARVAEQIWAATGLSAAQMAALDRLTYQIATLAGGAVASQSGGTITLSPDANQFGWFVDATPTSNEEYSAAAATRYVAAAGDAAGGVDLLTALLHEQGHLLGLDHVDSADDLMNRLRHRGRAPAPLGARGRGRHRGLDRRAPTT